MVSKHLGKLAKIILFLEDNSVFHKVAKSHKKLGYLYFEVLGHPAYTPDSAPSDYSLLT
jgi:hypothetical protein